MRGILTKTWVALITKDLKFLKLGDRPNTFLNDDVGEIGFRNLIDEVGGYGKHKRGQNVIGMDA